MLLKKTSLTILIIGSYIQSSPLDDSIKGAILGAALGDALGRVTEFIQTTASIKSRYGAHGVRSFTDFKSNDWVTHPVSKTKIAAYTDDTIMARIVLEESIKHHGNCLPSLAKRFIELFGSNRYQVDPLYDVRAHGPTGARSTGELAALQATHGYHIYHREAQEELRYKSDAVAYEGGCGSVMRAWPVGIVFNCHMNQVINFADDQSLITHRHPMARSASVAIAVGIAAILQSKKEDIYLTPEAIVKKMIDAAEKFDHLEYLYKTNALKKTTTTKWNQEDIAQDRLVTSDMIRYALSMAGAEEKPEKILGTHNAKQHNYRSLHGFLLGWAADEAVAAAVYVFIRHPHDLAAALQEAVNTPGDSDSIATLAGALVGAYSGWQKFEKSGFDYSKLENLDELEALASSACICAEHQYDLPNETSD